MKTYALYSFAALAEIAGCFAFWAWWRLEKSVWWLAPGMLSLVLFAWALALVPSEAAGRAYAAYGSIYILASILWLWMVEAGCRIGGMRSVSPYALPAAPSSCSGHGALDGRAA